MSRINVSFPDRYQAYLCLSHGVLFLSGLHGEKNNCPRRQMPCKQLSDCTLESPLNSLWHWKRRQQQATTSPTYSPLPTTPFRQLSPIQCQRDLDVIHGSLSRPSIHFCSTNVELDGDQGMASPYVAQEGRVRGRVTPGSCSDLLHYTQHTARFLVSHAHGVGPLLPWMCLDIAAVGTPSGVTSWSDEPMLCLANWMAGPAPTS